MGKWKTYHNIYLWENAMNVSKDNWVIHEIDFEKFNVLNKNTFSIGVAFNYPKQYFLLSEQHSNFEILIEQSSIGLHTVPFISFLDNNQTLFCLTNSCVVIDYKNKAILLQQELNTPCIDIVCINDIAYIVCEADIIKYSVKDNTLFDSLYLSDAVKEISIQNENCRITLYDGNLITLPF